MGYLHLRGAFQAWDRLTEAGFYLREPVLTGDEFRVLLSPPGSVVTYVGEGLEFREALHRALGAYLSMRFPRSV